MKFYKMDYVSIIAEYIVLDNPTKNLDDRGYYASWFQFLDKSLIKIEVSDYGGIEYPDLIIQDNIPIVSIKIKNILIKSKIKYLFIKSIDICDTKKRERYYLVVPPRIDCLDYKKSEYDSEIEYASKIVIDFNKVGDADMFRLKGIGNREIIVTERLFNLLNKEKLEGVYFEQL
ncbi:MAG: imm11 family protein [Cetobacterium sp.]